MTADLFDLADDFRRSDARIVLVRIARLLEEFADVPLVKQQRAELVRLRSGLERGSPGDAEAEYRRLFDPDHLDLSSLSRVTLRYDFADGGLGAWESGEWVHDGVGLVLDPRQNIISWDQLAAERGLRLFLREPLVLDRIELTLRFEALLGEVPARVLWITAGGFQVALSAPELPGSGSTRSTPGIAATRSMTSRIRRCVALGAPVFPLSPALK